jgi:hypothetical protein
VFVERLQDGNGQSALVLTSLARQRVAKVGVVALDEHVAAGEEEVELAVVGAAVAVQLLQLAEEEVGDDDGWVAAPVAEVGLLLVLHELDGGQAGTGQGKLDWIAPHLHTITRIANGKHHKHIGNVLVSVVDPKLFITDPDPTFQ